MTLPRLVPDFTRSDDETMERRLPSFDGRWSEQTRGILKKLGSDRLELNASWSRTPVDWRCPVCRRSKPEIARVTVAGVVLCQLDWHHDHLGDEGRAILWRGQEKFSDRAKADALSSAITVCGGLSERFRETLVCNDCNAADGAAKAALAGVVHPCFSFAPSEISRFILVAPNRSHDIDPVKASAIWGQVAEDVVDRLAFMSIMSDRIARGRHVREGPSYQADPKAVLLTDLLTSLGQDDQTSIECLAGRLEARSIQRDGFGSSVKKTARKFTAPPTKVDLDQFTASLRPQNFWHAPPENWRCDTCARSRLEMLRKSPKSGRWTADAHRRRVFTLETRTEALWWREGWYGDGLVYGAHEWVWICKDCRQIITDTKQTGRNLIDDCLSVQDVRELLISVKPHERPEFDRREAAHRAEQNREMMDAIRDYDRHRQRCLGLLYKRQQMLRFNAESVVNQLQLDEIWEAHVENAQRPDHLVWLLEEGRLYAEANARDWVPEREVMCGAG